MSGNPVNAKASSSRGTNNSNTYQKHASHRKTFNMLKSFRKFKDLFNCASQNTDPNSSVEHINKENNDPISTMDQIIYLGIPHVGEEIFKGLGVLNLHDTNQCPNLGKFLLKMSCSEGGKEKHKCFWHVKLAMPKY